MDRATFFKWLSEPRAIYPALPGAQRVLFVDNASGHYETNEIGSCLDYLRTVIQKFP